VARGHSSRRDVAGNAQNDARTTGNLPAIIEGGQSGLEQVGASGGAGAQHTPIYRDSSAEYVAVRKSDLREISQFGWLEEGAGAAGMFFLSGGFWLAAALLVEHSNELEKYGAGFGLCALSVIFGVVLMWIARNHFQMREQRISDYFKTTERDTDAKTPQ
jgi:hypothetical protein